MLGKSPDSPRGSNSGSEDLSSLEPVVEEDERVPGFEEPAAPTVQMSLAAELGVSESPLDSALQEEKLKRNFVSRTAVTTTAKGHATKTKTNIKRFTAQEKGKVKAMRASHVSIGRSKSLAGVEKENKTKAENNGSMVPPRISPPGTTGEKVAKPPPKINSVSVSRSRPVAKLPPPAPGGPRRVPVNSDEAPVGKGWRG